MDVKANRAREEVSTDEADVLSVQRPVGRSPRHLAVACPDAAGAATGERPELIWSVERRGPPSA
jgi:hypothetical protein